MGKAHDKPTAAEPATEMNLNSVHVDVFNELNAALGEVVAFARGRQALSEDSITALENVHDMLNGMAEVHDIKLNNWEVRAVQLGYFSVYADRDTLQEAHDFAISMVNSIKAEDRIAALTGVQVLHNTWAKLVGRGDL